MKETRLDLVATAAAVVLGILAFLVFAGWWVLIPTNVAWLEDGDRAMHTLGWFFFRDTPWGIPPGDSPRLGIELASSIALVDGLPLVAVPMKLLSQWLPRPFQYWGYWWLACFILQSLFAYRLARALDATRSVALIAATFAIIVPAFLYRLPLHMALAGHWVILAALWLYARRSVPRNWEWPLLCALTGAIHAYLLAMVAAIWMASMVQRWLLRSQRPMGLAGEAIVIAVALGLVLWTVGFFYTGTVNSVGFGYFRLNLLGPIITHGTWSQLVPSLPHSLYDYEGQSFFGIGVFATIIIAILTGSITDLSHLRSRRWWPAFLALFLFVVFALSNVVGLLGREAAPIPLVRPLELIGATFRSSGRFVWPALYSTTVVSVVLAARRLNPRVAIALLSFCVGAQIYDSRAGWGEFRSVTPPPATTWHTSLKSPFWDRAATSGYKTVRALRRQYRAIDWKDFEDYAYRYDMQIDAVYLGRIDARTLKDLYSREQSAIAAGTLEERTIYLLDLANARELAPRLAPDDLLATIDNRIVYLRHGAHLVDGLQIDPRGAATARPWIPEGVFFAGV